jgi:hypothetical protein
MLRFFRFPSTTSPFSTLPASMSTVLPEGVWISSESPVPTSKKYTVRFSESRENLGVMFDGGT